MAQRPTYEDLYDMPQPLRLFVLSPEFDAAGKTLQKTYSLSEAQMDSVGDKAMDAIFNESTLPQAVAELKTSLVPNPLTEDKWKLFVSDFLKLELWPLRELFGEELTQVLTENKIPTVGWPAARVMLKPLSYSGAASELANRVGLSLMNQQTRERLRDLVRSKVKGVRVDAQAREVLLRQADFGGLGLDGATADKVIAALSDLASSAKILSEDEYATWLAEQSHVESDTSKVGGGAPKTEDDIEIEKIRANMPATAESPASTLDQAVEQVFATLSTKPTDDYLAKRLRYIISSRLRDVRNQLEVRQLLVRDVKVGGLGIAKEQAETLSAEIERGYEQLHGSIKEEERKKSDTQQAEQKIKIEERRKREAEEHAAWYREKVVSRKQEEASLSGLVAHPVDVKQQKTEAARFGELVQAPVNALPAGQAAHPDVKVSKATVELKAAAPAKPRMDDVTPTYGGPRLTGPVQELKSLTLAEFRRIAKDPEAAAQKIMQRIDLLLQESFEQRIEGIKAWQSCPLQQAYMRLVAEAFRSGTPVVQLSETKRKAGEDVPSSDEIAAIVSLNSRIHF